MAVVKGGFWETNAGGVLTLAYPGYSSARRRAAMAFARMRAVRELATTLNGVVAGSAASATQKRVQAAEELGGRRVIETETLVSRNTTAADVTDINEDILTFSQTDTTPPVNLDRNPLGTR